MVKAKSVNDAVHGFYSVNRFSGIGFGIVLFMIGVIFLLRDLGYITSKISFWTYFFLIIGVWWVVGRLFRQ